jgi:hypothetical protein
MEKDEMWLQRSSEVSLERCYEMEDTLREYFVET